MQHSMAEPIEWAAIATAVSIAADVLSSIVAGKSIYDMFTTGNPVDLAKSIENAKEQIIQVIVEEIERQSVGSNMADLAAVSSFWNEEALPTIQKCMCLWMGYFLSQPETNIPLHSQNQTRNRGES
jgi:hypothetical protein